jgi:hypothetical protein
VFRIRDPVLFNLWIPDRDLGRGKNPDPDPGSGMNIPDHSSESLETFLGLKILKFFYSDPDPGSGIFLTLDPVSGMENPKPGSVISRIRNTVFKYKTKTQGNH